MSDLLDRIARLSPTKKRLLARQLGVEPGDGSSRDPIAIIGMACRFPGGEASPRGVDHPAAYWDLLTSGMDAIREVPADRWDADVYFSPDADIPGTMYTKWGGFVDGVDQFDAAFFGIAPREAANMDPQQRLFLEVAWEALESAGLDLGRLAGSSTGVYLGQCSNDYLFLNEETAIEAYAITGSSHCMGANRLSYLLDLKGPSFEVDTACSSSLVALHLACEGLRHGECEMALVGGANLILTPGATISFSRWGVLARDGRCKVFDARADGYVRGEGCGAVVLKRLSQARADGDPIHAVIKGTAVGQDGRSAGLTAPSVQGQAMVLRRALDNAGVDPADVGLIETHGTGTSLGDPIEVEALAGVYGVPRPEGSACALGAVKSCFGHLEAAAGVASVIKAVLALRHGQVPPNLHFQRLNPAINLSGTGFIIPTSTTAWPSTAPTRSAGVSSFGFGGTNAHVILEEAGAEVEAERPLAPQRPAWVLPVSARSELALRSRAGQMAGVLETDQRLADVVYTAARRRTAYPYRLAVVGTGASELSEQLGAFVSGESRPGLSCDYVAPGTRPRLVLVFPGQGSQWLGMGRRLAATEPVFRSCLATIQEAFRAFVDWSLLEQLEGSAATSRIDEIDVIQPALFAIEVGLASLWRSWGIEPAAVIGHSMGEVAAAHVAGALSLEDAARVICCRSRLLRRVSGRGAMAVVELGLDQAGACIQDVSDRLAVAVSNSPKSTVLSGDPEALELVLGRLEEQGVFCRRVKVEVASHSPQMDELRADLEKALHGLRPRSGNLPIYSTVLGEPIRGAELDGAYWVRNLRQPVLFSGMVERLLEDGHRVFLELSPHPILVPAVEETMLVGGHKGLALGSMRREEDDALEMGAALGRLWTAGVEPRWEQVLGGRGRVVDLPPYPWQRERFWLETRSAGAADGSHPLLGTGVPLSTGEGVVVWTRTLSIESHPYLADHRIHGIAVMPAAAYLEMALAAGQEALGQAFDELQGVEILEAMLLVDGAERLVQLVLTSDDADRSSFRIVSRAGEDRLGGWTEHARGTIARSASPVMRPAERPEELAAECGEVVDPVRFYNALAERGLEYGDAFRQATSIWRGSGLAVATLELPAAAKDGLLSYHLHPAFLDAALQCSAVASSDEAVDDRAATYMPVRIDRLRLGSGRATGGWVRARLEEEQGTTAGSAERIGHIEVWSRDGLPVVEVSGLHMRRVEVAAAARARRLGSSLYEIAWRQAALEERTGSGSGGWLILADRLGVGERLAEVLEQAGSKVVLACVGPCWSDHGSGRFELDPTSEASWDQLLGAVPETRRVVYLWGLDLEPAGDDIGPVASLVMNDPRGWAGALQLVKALGRMARTDLDGLWLVSRGVHRVTGDEPLDGLACSPLWGLGRVIANEYPGLHCRRIDLGPADVPEQVPVLATELRCNSDAEEEIALRPEGRFVGRLVQASLVGQRVLGRSKVRFGGDRSYLITGGLRGIGLEVARWMTARGAGRLILLGRSEPDAATSAVLSEMAAGGARIATVAADVTVREELEQRLGPVLQEGPPLAAVVHGAGVLDDGVLRQLDRDRFARVLAPKVDGTLNVYRLCAGAALESFVLFSSTAALLGPPGQGSHAAANAFLDALACALRARGVPAVSINWGPWAEVGAAASHAEAISREGFRPLGIEESLQLLEAVLQADVAQVAAVQLDVAQMLRFNPLLANRRWASELVQLATGGPGAGSGVHRLDEETLRGLDATERLRLVEQRLREQIATEMGFSPSRLRLDQPLTELGIDSLMALRLKNRIEAISGVRVPVTMFFEGASVSDLCGHLIGALGVAGSKPEAPSRQPVTTGAAAASSRAQLRKAARQGRRSGVEQHDAITSE